VSSHNIGADLLVVAIPDPAQIGSPEMQAPYRILARECADLQIPFLDMTHVFEQQTDVESCYLFPLDAHNNPRGNAVIAAALHEFIADMFPAGEQ
jgi:hypothetical protein